MAGPTPAQLPPLSPFELPLTRPHRTISTYPVPNIPSVVASGSGSGIGVGAPRAVSPIQASSAVSVLLHRTPTAAVTDAHRKHLLELLLARKHQTAINAMASAAGGVAGGPIDTTATGAVAMNMTNVIINPDQIGAGSGLDTVPNSGTATPLGAAAAGSGVHKQLVVELPGSVRHAIPAPVMQSTVSGGIGSPLDAVPRHVIMPSGVPLHSRHLPVQHQPMPVSGGGSGGGSRFFQKSFDGVLHLPNAPLSSAPVLTSTSKKNASRRASGALPVHPHFLSSSVAPTPSAAAVQSAPFHGIAPTPTAQHIAIGLTPIASPTAADAAPSVRHGADIGRSSAPPPQPPQPQNLAPHYAPAPTAQQPAPALAPAPSLGNSGIASNSVPLLPSVAPPAPTASLIPTTTTATPVVAPTGGTTAMTVSDAEARSLLPPAYSLPAGYMIVRTRAGGVSGGSRPAEVSFTVNANDSPSATANTIEGLSERIELRTRMLRLFKLLMVWHYPP